MRLLFTTRYSLKTCLRSSSLRPPTTFSINPCPLQHLSRVSFQSSSSSSRRTFAVSSRLFHQPTPRTDHNRESEKKATPGVSDKIQSGEKVWTVPNALTISRIFSCPVLGYAILHDNFYAATGLLVYAGLTDLVRGGLLCSTPQKSLIHFIYAFSSMVTWHGSTTWVLSLARSLTQRRTRH